MRCVYLDCASGVSGDMFLGALIDAGAAFDTVVSRLDSLGIPGLRLEVEEVKRKGFRGKKIHIRHPPEHAHRHVRDILAMVEGSALTARERKQVERVFRKLAEAEAKVHGTSPEKVHFHEVGAVDSIADVVGTCVAWDSMQADLGLASPVAVGGGFVEIAHGRCSVPAPATAELLSGFPVVSGPVEAELTTPTGAALLTCLAQPAPGFPRMTLERIGYGAGTFDFESHPNLLRVVVGTVLAAETTSTVQSDQVLCLETNLDDCPGELLADCVQRLFQAGAWDVYTVPIMMKKGRPGVLLGVLCEPIQRAKMEQIMFQGTTTLGIRSRLEQRSKLERQAVWVETELGPLRGKHATLPDGTPRVTVEYESARECAERHAKSVEEVFRIGNAACLNPHNVSPMRETLSEA